MWWCTCTWTCASLCGVSGALSWWHAHTQHNTHWTLSRSLAGPQIAQQHMYMCTLYRRQQAVQAPHSWLPSVPSSSSSPSLSSPLPPPTCRRIYLSQLTSDSCLSLSLLLPLLLQPLRDSWSWADSHSNHQLPNLLTSALMSCSCWP